MRLVQCTEEERRVARVEATCEPELWRNVFRSVRRVFGNPSTSHFHPFIRLRSAQLARHEFFSTKGAGGIPVLFWRHPIQSALARRGRSGVSFIPVFQWKTRKEISNFSSSFSLRPAEDIRFCQYIQVEPFRLDSGVDTHSTQFWYSLSTDVFSHSTRIGWFMVFRQWSRTVIRLGTVIGLVTVFRQWFR